MLTLQHWFIESGWDPAYIAYAVGGISLIVLGAIYFYVKSDDFLE